MSGIFDIGVVYNMKVANGEQVICHILEANVEDGLLWIVNPYSLTIGIAPDTGAPSLRLLPWFLTNNYDTKIPVNYETIITINPTSKELATHYIQQIKLEMVSQTIKTTQSNTVQSTSYENDDLRDKLINAMETGQLFSANTKMQ